MAEIFGVVASGISLAQLAVQLLSSVEELRTLSRSIRNAPKNLQATLDGIEAISQIFYSIEAFDECSFPAHGWKLLKINFLNCQASASNLKDLVTGLISKLNKTSKLSIVHLVNAHLSREEIKELTMRLDSTKSSLQLAMTCITIHMMQNLMVTEHRHKKTQDPSQKSLSDSRTEAAPGVTSLTVLPGRHRKSLSINDPLLYQRRQCSLNKCCCSCHDTFVVQGGGWSVKLPSTRAWKTCSKSSCQNSKNASIWISFTKLGIPWAVDASFNFMFGSNRSRITPSLDFQRVVKNTSPGFELLWKLQTRQIDDWSKARQDLLNLFELGRASPLDVDPNGQTWLEKVLDFSGTWSGVNTAQLPLATLLIQLGTQVNTSRLLYQCASWGSEGHRLALLDELICFGFDTSEIEPPTFPRWPKPCRIGDSGPDPFFVEWTSKNIRVSPGFAGMNPLLEAILIGSSDEVKHLLNQIPVNEQENLLGQSALHLAVYRPQHLEIILKSGADVDARDKYGITPLMYAGAMGEAQIAIRLLNCGANPFITVLHRNLFGFATSQDFPEFEKSRNFLEFAKSRGEWNLIRHVLSHAHCSAKSLDFDIRDLLGMGFALLINATFYEDWEKRSNYLQTLLEWGANPNTQCYDALGRSTGTIIHRIGDMELIKSIVTHGFTLFNHVDHEGNHALISSTTEPNLEIMELLIDGGSFVDHQNHEGHTALHEMIQRLKCATTAGIGEHQFLLCYGINAIDCIRLLLRRGSHPCSQDKCQCACSRSGCTPGSLILKEHPTALSSRQDIWAIEYYSIVEEERGPEAAKQCILDMLRLLKFEELEITHTCHQETAYFKWYIVHGDKVIEDEEIEEILDEEKELAQTLEREMLAIENLPKNDLEQLLLSVIQQRKWDRELEMKSQLASPEYTSRYTSYEVDYWRDKFITKSGSHSFDFTSNTPDTVGVSGYLSWVEYAHAENQQHNKPDDEWYRKRTGWISSIQSMYEKAAMEESNEGKDISEERISFIPDI